MNNYFCGWYFKCQSKQDVISVIPAIHINNGKKSCSIQLITSDQVWNVEFPYCSFRKKKKAFMIGENYFSAKGVSFHLYGEGIELVGKLKFGAFQKLGYDIMGPFRYIPYMECRHKVFSMKHTVNGTLYLNGVEYHFENGLGYMEGDQGRSFPKKYLWTQCCLPTGSLMLSVADIPFGCCTFTGIIGVVDWKGKRYRFATYLGARVMKIKKGMVVIKQGNMVFTVRLLKKKEQPLYAPVHGEMNRTIHESTACLVGYELKKRNQIVFSFEEEMASFEYEYPF